jgi:hypothetical protein
MNSNTDNSADVKPASPSGSSSTKDFPAWKKIHLALAGTHHYEDDKPPKDLEDQRRQIEPWLSALCQAEHLNLLVGNGLTSAVAAIAGVEPADMAVIKFNAQHAEAVQKAAEESAKATGRGKPNFEDQIRAALQFIEGLRVLARADHEQFGPLLEAWEKELNRKLTDLLKSVLKTEQELAKAFEEADGKGKQLRRYLGSFLLSFASRTATRERLHIFTTNYDRVLEFGCDLLGLRVIDRFVGRLKPVFRSSRLGVDMHYNPPGIRGEPRYLEGVVRLTKLHGSLDWRQESVSGECQIVRVPLPFGAPKSHPDLPADPLGRVLIYPSPAKDVETSAYPYADLFRDFAAAICQPNSVLITYGYGFGDDHINRVLRDMLTIPSAHLAIISWDNASGRIQRFVESLGSLDQVTLLLGNHFGDLKTLVDHYLPKSAIDRTTLRMVELVNRRTIHPGAPLQGNELPKPEA